MDLSQFDGLAKAQDEGIDVEIFHPKTGEKTGITIKVAGPESERQKRFRRMLMNDRLVKNRNRRVTVTEIEEDALRLSAASIISWDGIELNGQKLDYTTANAEKILGDYPFIRDQVDAVVNDRTVFIKS